MNAPTRHAGVQVEAPDDAPVILMTRDFAATPAQLRRAHLDPEIFARWIGPKGYVTEIDRWDARTGGSWRFTHQGHGFFGSFHEVGHDRLVQTFTWEGMPTSVSVDTLTFEDLGDGRTRLRTKSFFESFPARDGMLSSGMEGGVSDGYEKLDDLLADGAL
ncbi:polyketide cyclase [Aeromicrobium sp. Root495]|uniref:SRPBCC domain-containing protein n=1 Tax=Aeromicrobium sp. Root495 TaxID=1736550 RepID=UPI0006F8320B|nr:SRPBCC domain-containing protein [Aeromicrobium sp. Root495]KQY56101.1 polyketide cyclase [Aeromicrobium sp. Root495]